MDQEKKELNADSMTKAQLQREVARLREHLEKRDIELRLCKQELQGLKVRLEGFEHGPRSSTDEKSNEAGSDVASQAAAKKMKSLERSITKLEKKNRQLEEAKKALEASLKDFDAQKRELAEARSEIGRLEKELAELQRRREAEHLNRQDTEGQKEAPERYPSGQTASSAILAPPRALVEPRRPTRTQRPEARCVRAVAFVQHQQQHALNQPLRPWTAITLEIAFDLPVSVSWTRLEHDGSEYFLQCRLLQEGEKHPMAVVDAIGLLQEEQRHYSASLEFPGLAPGAYRIDVRALVPAARIGEQFHVSCVVEA